MDAISRDLQKEVPWTLLYADDVMLACEDKSALEQQVQAWAERLAKFGLRLNVNKTEYMTTDPNEAGSIKIEGTVLKRTETFKYLGSALASDGSLNSEVSARVSAAWSKWRSMSGILRDKHCQSGPNQGSIVLSRYMVPSAALRPKKLRLALA